MGLWRYVSSIGVSKEVQEANDPKRLIFFNQVLFIGLFATFFQVVTMWQFIGVKALVFLLISFVSFISLLLNHKGYSSISKKLFMLVVYATGAYTTVLLGGAGLYHLGAFVIFVSSLIIFDIRKEFLEIILGIPFLILSIGIGEFGWFDAPDFSSHEAYAQMRISSIANLFVIISILTIFIVRLNHKNEEKLNNRQDELEDLVKARTQELTNQKSILEEQNKEKEILLQEVHHRVKNNLQIIVSLINLQHSKNDIPEVDVALKDIQGRVLSMSLAHQKMYQTSHFASIDLKKYMESLIENVMDLHHGSEVKYELNFVNEGKCDVERAIPIGLIFNEILSNFFKHAFTSSTSSFSISLELDNDSYRLLYKDNGKGFPEGYSVDELESLGLHLIESLTEQIDGEFEFYNEDGAVYEFSFKKNVS